MSKPSPSKLLSTYRYSLATAGLAITLAGFGYYRSTIASELENSITENRTTLNNLKQNQASGTKITEHISEISSHLEKIATRFAQGENYALNLQYFYKIENEAGVKITNISKSEDTKTARPGKSTTAFNVNIEGTYLNILKFMAISEKGSYYGRILNFTLSSISSTTEDKPADGATCSLLIELYTPPAAK